jgi:flagellar assembly protein FliH
MTGKANAYLAQVKTEAAKIIAEARQEAAQLRKQAQEQGQRAATETAEKSLQTRIDSQLKQQMKTALPAIEQVAKSLSAERLRWLQAWEGHAVRLALAIAEKIVRRELAQHPEIAVSLVREALELAAGSQSIKVHLHPQDHEALGKQIAELARQISSATPAEIVADEEVTAGGCVVHTEFGVIDQRVESQLARIAEELF